MRAANPRRGLERRRRARARVQIIDLPQSDSSREGSVTSRQVAEVTLPRAELDRIWSPEYLERLARTYWRYLSRISLGLLRVLYTPDSRRVVLITKPFVLLRFFAPEYEIETDRGTVTWRINRGLLVAPMGRGKGFLRISVERPADAEAEEVTARVTSEVANFYPMIAGWGWFWRVGRAIYRETQLRLHVLITNGFLRSLARLDLAESRVGRFRRAQLAQSPPESPVPSPQSPERAPQHDLPQSPVPSPQSPERAPQRDLRTKD